MSETVTYEKLNKEERAYVSSIIKRRWWHFIKILFLSLSLPYVIAITVVRLLNIVILPLRAGDPSIHQLSITSLDEFYFWVLGILYLGLPVFVIIVVVNIVLFINKIPPIYIDFLRGKKKEITFYPVLCPMAEFSQYYIKTAIPKYLYFQIDNNTYSNLNENEPLTLELLPSTKIFLRLKNKAGEPIQTNYIERIKFPLLPKYDTSIG